MIQNANTFITTGQAVTACSALMLMNSYFYYRVEVAHDLNVFKENQLLENLQVFLIMIAGLTFSQAVFLVEKSLRLFLLSGSLLSFSFILRELDVEKFDVPPFIAFLFGSGYGRNTLLAGLWLAVVIVFVKSRTHHLKIALGLLGQRSGIFAVTGGLLLILGGLFDDRVFDVALYQFYEELAELNGYFFLLLSSFYLPFDLKHGSTPGQSFAVRLQKP
ncbi:MAG: hypothetical protein ACU841_03185 [Gammaproteobacteria bacterium]